MKSCERQTVITRDGKLSYSLGTLFFNLQQGHAVITFKQAGERAVEQFKTYLNMIHTPRCQHV